MHGFRLILADTLRGARFYRGVKIIAAAQKTCEHCGKRGLIPADSQEAKDILHERGSLSRNY